MHNNKKYILLAFLINISFAHVVSAWQDHLKEFSAFSLLVYHNKTDEPPIPNGFTLLCSCPMEFQKKDYYAEAYYIVYPPNNSGMTGGWYESSRSKVVVVITHRGTILKSGNLSDDLEVALKAAPDSFFVSSKPFTDYVKSLISLKFPPKDFFYEFIHTGHSLGAIHAELNSIYQKDQNIGMEISAVVFESPGSKEIINSLIKKGVLFENVTLGIVHIINAEVNFINSFSEQSVCVRRICPGYNFSDIIGLDLSPIDIKYFSTAFTIDQHSMANIYQYFANGGELLPFGYTWPIGIKNAFEFYRIYNHSNWSILLSSKGWLDSHQNALFSKNHMRYWDQAIKLYWDKHQEVHAEYKDNYDNYHEYIIQHYLSGK